MFEIDTAALTASLQNTDGLSESIQFEQLMRIFDLSPRPLPQQLEISLLNDKNQSYGLLLESPEPLPAERVQGITISMTSVSQTIDEFHNTLKLIRADIQRITPPGEGVYPDFNEQWVEVLLLEKTDLSGYRIEYRDNAAEDEAFNLFYTFAPASVYPAGTKLIIHSGVKPDVATSQRNTCRSMPDTSQPFIPSGTYIRLVDAMTVLFTSAGFSRILDIRPRTST